MTGPSRIQRKRAKGWTMPPGAVYVGRPSRWGNPWVFDPARATTPPRNSCNSVVLARADADPGFLERVAAYVAAGHHEAYASVTPSQDP